MRGFRVHHRLVDDGLRLAQLTGGRIRLLHVVEGGDYGYRFRNGRKGTHPFTSWNGELPGTLPMVAALVATMLAALPFLKSQA